MIARELSNFYFIYMNTIKLNLPQAIDSNRVRIGAFFVFIMSILSLLFYFNPYISLIFSLILWVDFLLSFIGGLKFSLFSFLIEFIHSHYIQKESWISPKPKRFAKLCGLTMLTIALVSFLFNQQIYFILIGMLALFSFLEGAFDFCIGCKIYSILQKVGLISKDSCENC